MRETLQHQNLMDQKKLCCSVCLDLLKDPVTIPCGHSYCMNCVRSHWDQEDHKNIYSCPQCRKTVSPRPTLVKNTMMADLVEELKETGPQAVSADPSYVKPGDVSCDFCAGRKLRALKSCQQGLVSYYELVDPNTRLQENICTHHGEVKKIFCSTDHQCVCVLCSLEQHKDHHTVLALTERTQRQGELGTDRQRIQQRIQSWEEGIKVLQERLDATNLSADRAVKYSDRISTQLLKLIQTWRSEVRQQIRARQKTEAGLTKELKEKLDAEMMELRRTDAELEHLSHTDDHTEFLQSSLSLLRASAGCTNTCPLQYFQDVMAAVSGVRDQLQESLTQAWTRISPTVRPAEVSQPQAEPKTRAQFLLYSCETTLDPNTANSRLLVSEGERRATVTREKQAYPNHPDRFTDMFQVLSRESLSRRHYWEVDRSRSEVSVAVAFRNISRTGYESGFGNDDRSWAVECFNSSFQFRHNSSSTSVPGPQSSLIGVYLDHSAGTLCFYSVCENMTLLHRVQTTFSEPLHQGLGVFATDSLCCAAKLCQLEKHENQRALRI